MRAAFLVPLACWALATPAFAGEGDAVGEWRPLFDPMSGEGLVGMRDAPFPAQSWRLEDGLLRTLEDGSGGDVRTARRYENFELAFEWKILAGGNSGVKYVVQEEWIGASFQPDLDDQRREQLARQAVGYEYQLFDDAVLKKSRPDWETSSTAAFYLIRPPVRKNLHSPGEWNSARIVVRGAHVEHWLNGEKALEFELGSDEVLAQVERTKFRRMPGYGLPGRGYVVFQHHGRPAWFRDVKIRAAP